MNFARFYMDLANSRTREADAFADEHLHVLLQDSSLTTLREVSLAALHTVKDEGISLGYSDATLEAAFKTYGEATGRLILFALAELGPPAR